MPANPLNNTQTRFKNNFAFSQTIINKSSYAKEHKLCLHNDLNLSAKRLEKLFDAVGQNNESLVLTDLGFIENLRNFIMKIAHFFLPNHFNSESNDVIALKLIYNHVKLDHNEKTILNTIDTVLKIANLCKNPDEFISAISIKKIENSDDFTISIQGNYCESFVFRCENQNEFNLYFEQDISAQDAEFFKFKVLSTQELTKQKNSLQNSEEDDFVLVPKDTEINKNKEEDFVIADFDNLIPCLISSFTLLLRRLCTRYAVYVHCAPRAA